MELAELFDVKHATFAVTPERRKWELWENVKEQADELVEALYAWKSEWQRFCLPDGTDVARAIAEGFPDDREMHVEAKDDYDAAVAEAQTLGKALRGITEYLKAGHADLIDGYLKDCRRFDKDLDRAWREHVEE